MKILVPLALSLSLMACATKEASTVVLRDEAPKTKAVNVSAPPKLRTNDFKFQSPNEKSSVVALDEKNYNNFRQFLLAVSAREEDWKNRLTSANKTISTLSGETKTIQAE